MTVTERVAYIRGLFDGLGLDGSKSGEARILSEVLDTLREMGLRLDRADAAVDALDRDLSALKNAAPNGGPDKDRAPISCPSCGKRLAVDGKVLSAGVLSCPACGGRFALSFEDGEKSDQSK